MLALLSLLATLTFFSNVQPAAAHSISCPLSSPSLKVASWGCGYGRTTNGQIKVTWADRKDHDNCVEAIAYYTGGRRKSLGYTCYRGIKSATTNYRYQGEDFKYVLIWSGSRYMTIYK